MIILKTDNEIRIMREGGKILAGILKRIGEMVKPGATTGELEEAACELIEKAGGRPAFKGYAGHDAPPYPTALCTSINNEVVHAPALPSRTLKSGDIIGIDVGMEYPFGKGKHGYYTDMAATYAVGKISKDAKRLMAVTKKSLNLAIGQVKPGNGLNDIGKAVQSYVEKEGFSIVRELVGHGVGTEVHEDPQVPNYEIFDESENCVLKSGMTIAIEPMVNMGGWRVKFCRDGFTVATYDGGLSAHFEHTVAVTKTGCEVLTRL